MPTAIQNTLTIHWYRLHASIAGSISIFCPPLVSRAGDYSCAVWLPFALSTVLAGVAYPGHIASHLEHDNITPRLLHMCLHVKHTDLRKSMQLAIWSVKLSERDIVDLLPAECVCH